MYKKALEVIDTQKLQETFQIMDLGSIKQRIAMWKEHLPDVTMHYAVKANDNSHLLKVVLDEGANFDCASMAEIEHVLSLGAKPQQIIYANTCKAESHIHYAKQVGVRLMTFDSVEEAEKVIKIFPEAELVLRIAVEETDAPCPMGRKFGAPLELWDEILDYCQKSKVNLRGVSFHVGSGGCSVDVYKSALAGASTIFDKVEALNMKPLDLLDIGGGFSVSYSCNKDWKVINQANTFETAAPAIRDLIKTIFPESVGKSASLKVIGEPGRLVCQDAVSTVTRIYLAKQQPDTRHYYVDSGVYQAFPCQTIDGEFFRGQPMLTGKVFQSRVKKATNSFIWGQTCDGVDWLMKDMPFPRMERGEWILYRGVGAYN